MKIQKVSKFVKTFRFKMLLLMLLCITIPSSTIGIFAYYYSKDVLIEGGKEDLARTGNMAKGFLDSLAKQVDEGTLTKDQAIQKAKDTLLGPVGADGLHDTSQSQFRFGEGTVVGQAINTSDFSWKFLWNKDSKMVTEDLLPGFPLISREDFEKSEWPSDGFKEYAKMVFEENDFWSHAGKLDKELVVDMLSDSDKENDFQYNYNTLPGVANDNYSDPSLLYKTVLNMQKVDSWSNNEKLLGAGVDLVISSESFYHEFYGPVNKMASVIALIVSITTAFGLISAYIILRRSATALSIVGDAINRFGRGDLTTVVKVKGKDEFAKLAKDLNTANGMMSGMLKDVQKVTNEVTHLSQHLNEGSDQTGKAAEQIATTVTRMAEDVVGMKDTVESTTDIIKELQSEIESVTSKLEAASFSVENALESANSGKETSAKIQCEMARVNDTVQHSSNVVLELGSRVEKIGEITQLITQIASQTNLLALNAAIEAARAGEHGKGFAVVAEEVRKLAEATSKAGEEIISMLDEIQTRTGQAVTVIQNGASSFGEVGVMMNSSLSSYDDITKSVELIYEQIKGIYEASSSINQQADIAYKKIQNVNDISGEMTDGMGMIAASSEEQVATLEENIASATNVSELVEDLKNKVSQFKVH
ncbi:methyl-accepting chemotaxis protein [Bacillus sp. 31A1R]|uniref:Methyl-accepting chemotaxis protein n=1 Tax=Robertmurraya mangrovi TaxID=3098077 RepID=A0ABU5IYF3_9BACI|nr:methyl-accepting chemotaxis protein [Bacillus sp. 31A1R]MDZ5472193.1 methyl-accepting chemotaxis protein [Bacillus sp. 31A1R]